MTEEYQEKPTKSDFLFMLNEMINNIEKLPPNAMHLPINHYDFSALLILLFEIFKLELNNACTERT